MIEKQITPYDPRKLIQLRAIRPLFANGKRMDIDEKFQVQAQHAGEILITMRADFVDQDDRGSVYKKVEHF